MNKDDTIKLANRKIEHEHSRWNTWVIFFFGALISTFTLWGHFKEDVPAYVPFIACATLSLLWVFVALGMRRFTASWVKVIGKVEEEGSSDDLKPNEMFISFETDHSYCKDFCDFSLFRVSKVLTYIGVVLFFTFVILVILSIKTPPKKSQRVIELRHLSELVEGTKSYNQKVDSILESIDRVEKRLNHIEKAVEKYNKPNAPDSTSR